MEVTVGNNLGVGSVVSVGVNVGHVRGKGFAVYGEGGSIKYMEGAVGKFLFSFGDCFGSACGSNSGVDLAEFNGTVGDAFAPVGSDFFAVQVAVYDVLKVRSPVDSGGYDEGVGASCNGAAVVRKGKQSVRQGRRRCSRK